MLPDLRLRVGADTVDLERSLDEVSDRIGGLRGVADNTARGLQSFGDNATALGRRMLPLSAGVSALAAGMFATANATARAGNEIHKASTAAGLGTDAFQELRFAVGQVSDLSDDQFANSMQQLSRRMGQAVEGSESMAAAFAAVGVSVDDIRSGAVGTEEAFMALAAAMQETESPSQAAALAAELLGREGARLGPILREAGGDIQALRDRAQELGIVMGADAVAASAEFADQMDELRRQAGALRDRVGAALLPVMIAFMRTVQDRVIPAVERLANGIAGAIEWFGNLPAPVQEAAGIIAGALGVGGPVLLAIGALSRTLAALVAATGPIGLLIVAASLLVAAWNAWGDDIVEIVGDTVDWVTTKFTEIIDFFRELPSQMIQMGRDVIAGLWQGLRAAWDEFSIVDTMRGWGSDMLSAIGDRIGWNSPATEFIRMGEDIGRGLDIGLRNGFGLVQSAVSGMGDIVTGGALDMAQQVVGAFGQMFQGSKPIAAAMALINTLQGMTEALKLPFPANLGAAAQVLARGMAAVRGIQSARPGSAAPPSGASGGGGSAASIPVQRMIIETQGSGAVPQSSLQSIIDQINEAGRRGHRIDAQFIGGAA